jgi:hypothetical protein
VRPLSVDFRCKIGCAALLQPPPEIGLSTMSKVPGRQNTRSVRLTYLTHIVLGKNGELGGQAVTKTIRSGDNQPTYFARYTPGMFASNTSPASQLKEVNPPLEIKPPPSGSVGCLFRTAARTSKRGNGGSADSHLEWRSKQSARHGQELEFAFATPATASSMDSGNLHVYQYLFSSSLAPSQPKLGLPANLGQTRRSQGSYPYHQPSRESSIKSVSAPTCSCYNEDGGARRHRTAWKAGTRPPSGSRRVIGAQHLQTLHEVLPPTVSAQEAILMPRVLPSAASAVLAVPEGGRGSGPVSSH